MIAKLITSGKTRVQAIAHMRTALNQFYLSGVAHNLSFLAALVGNKSFDDGELSTNLIAELYPEGYEPAPYDPEAAAVPVVVAATAHFLSELIAASNARSQPCSPRAVARNWIVVIEANHHPVEVCPLQERGQLQVCFEQENYRVKTDWQPGQPLLAAEIDGTPVHVKVERQGIGYRLRHDGCQYDVRVLSARAAKLLSWMPKTKGHR